MKDDLSWDICYGMYGKLRKGLSRGEEGPVTIKITYLPLDPEAETPRQILKPLLFGLLWLSERSRVHDIAIVPVQALRDAVDVPRVECPKPFMVEFDLWGIGTFRVRHWDGAIERGLRGDPEASCIDPQVLCLYSHNCDTFPATSSHMGSLDGRITTGNWVYETWS